MKGDLLRNVVSFKWFINCDTENFDLHPGHQDFLDEHEEKIEWEGTEVDFYLEQYDGKFVALLNIIDEPVMVDLKEPIGKFILDQKDIVGVMGNDGMYYHYSQVCLLLGRLNERNER